MAEYRDCIVCFFDVLGFSEMVEHSSPTDIESRLDALLRYSSLDPALKKAFEAEAYHFSDTVVRVTPLDSDNGAHAVGLLFHEVLDLVHIQMELVKHAVWVRGGVTVGKVRFTERQVFGPGLVRAHQLESELAQFPRIVLDPSLLAALGTDVRLRKDTHSADEERRHMRNLLRRDADGLWFVDYLRAGESEVDEPEFFELMLKGHRAAISAQIAKHPKLDRVGQKLAWMAQYHNNVVQELLEDGLPPEKAQALRIEIPASLVAPL